MICLCAQIGRGQAVRSSYGGGSGGFQGGQGAGGFGQSKLGGAKLCHSHSTQFTFVLQVPMFLPAHPPARLALTMIINHDYGEILYLAIL